MLPPDLPSGGARSQSLRNHFDYRSAAYLATLPFDVALATLVELANEALAQYSDGLSEDAREPYDGTITIHRDQLRVRYGRLPRDAPDDGWRAPELAPITIAQVALS